MNPEITEENSIIASDAGGGKHFDPIPEGTHIARCIEMIHIGTVEEEFSGKKKTLEKVRLTWELPFEIIESSNEDYNGKPRIISNEYTLSLNSKATLRKHLDAWRGKAFTEDEAKAFNVSKLIGIPCQVTIIHKESKGKTYANISSISGLSKGMTAPDQITEGRIITVNNLSDYWESIPEYIQKKIVTSKEYLEAFPKGMTNIEEEKKEEEKVSDMPF